MFVEETQAQYYYPYYGYGYPYYGYYGWYGKREAGFASRPLRAERQAGVWGLETTTISIPPGRR
ncbi:hypothetical protein AAVH_10321 [Aphelenchoides avenae]|nr:hypothetical protein AAVH_10321 [Aphelenchus avenae]